MTTDTDKTATSLRRQLELVPLGERGITPTNIDELFRLAQAISISKICPPGFSETDCFVVMATGLELGLSPFTAIQNMYVVNNRASIFGDVALGLIRARGLLEEYKQEYFGTPFNDDYGARVTSKRKGMADAIVTEYSVADAKRAKRWNGEKSAGAGPWVTDPKRMLLFRARSFNLRDNFGDILKGVSVDTDDDEVIAGFEHAKAAQGKVVEPNFDSAPKGLRRLGVELPSESIAEPVKDAPALASEAPPAKRGPGRPRKSEKTDLFDPPKPAVPPPEPPTVKEPEPDPFPPLLSQSAAEVLHRLQAENLELANFIKLMARNEYLEGQGEDLQSVAEDGLALALDQWPKVVEHLKQIKDEEQRPFA